MKYLSIALLTVACSGDAPTESTDKDNSSTEQVQKPVDNKGAAEGHDGMKHGDDHGKVDAGAHIGPVPEGAKVFFVEPKDGATVTSPVKIQMGVEGMEVKPAGKIQDGSGHHHIVIDSDPVAKGTLVPADDKHKHFGKGQTETELQLAPGQHTLQLQFANGVHLSYGEQMSAKITITVE